MKIIQLIVFLAISGKIAARLRRSVGGFLMRIEQAPYFVSIQLDGIHVCGGALVTAKHVVTAASCRKKSKFKSYYDDMKVVSGRDVKNSLYGQSSIAEFEVHGPIPTDYIKNRHRDIAVITLLQPIELTTKQNTILLPKAGPSYSEVATLIAFKSKYPLRHPTPLHGMFTTMEYTNFFTTDDGFKMLIGQDGILYGRRNLHQRLWKGDAGSPLVHNGILVGVATFTKSGSPNHDIYTDVFEYVNFIRNETDLEEVP